MSFEFKRFFQRLYEEALNEDIFGSAARIGFYFIFALFPFVLFLINGLSLILEKADNLRTEFFTYLQQIMPPSAFELLEKTLTEILAASSGGKLTLGFLLAIWSASVGFDSIRIGLNAIFDLTETRPWWKQKLVAVSVTLATGLLILLMLALIFYGGILLHNLLPEIIIRIISFVIVLLFLIIIFAIIYSFCPDHPDFVWSWITPGAIAAIVLWLILSVGFRVYLSYFDTYEKTYGSLGALIILLLWLYLTALVILIGGLINSILNEFSAGKEKTEDKE